MSLFEWGNFVLHSGLETHFRINAEALSDESVNALAQLFLSMHPLAIGEVISIPTGGDRFAAALRECALPGGHLTVVVDDVWTTGGSMEAAFEEHHPDLGVVIFDRGPVPLATNVLALFHLNQGVDWQVGP